MKNVFHIYEFLLALSSSLFYYVPCSRFNVCISSCTQTRTDRVQQFQVFVLENEGNAQLNVDNSSSMIHRLRSPFVIPKTIDYK